jgi:SAM-dependent methyltransferase
MSEEIYAAPRHVEDPTGCLFYHTMEIPSVGLVKGQWDLRGRIHDYLGGVPLTGRRVLDVGTASGFLSFEMERLGAEVVSMDADTADRITMLPFPNSLYTTDRDEWMRGTNAYLDTLKNSYWLSHRLLKSRNRVYYGDIYDLPQGLGMFDVCVVGQVLVHLRDPITALGSISRRCGDTLIVTEGMLESDDRVATFFARAETGPEWIWWQYSTGMFRELMGITKNVYPCSHEYTKGETAVHTLVARRNR